MARKRMLVVEDDPAIRRGLVDSLSFAGFHTVECADGPSAREALAGGGFDLVLLDVVLPGLNGLEYLPELRRMHPRLPVIMVTARGAEEDRVRGLRHGADDYVVKPFSATELIARVEAVLRRSAERPLELEGLEFPTGTVDFVRREVRPSAGPVKSLTERENDVLRFLAREQGRPIERDELLRCVWGLDPRGLDTRTVDMTIVRLREKLSGLEREVVVTVRGKGYRFGGVE